MAKTATESEGLKIFLEKTYKRSLSDNEVLEYKNRLVKFFSLLIEIDQRNKRKSNETKNN